MSRIARLVAAVASYLMIMSGVALAQDPAVLAEVDRAMENYRLDAHIPGMVWGIVQDGRLVHVKGTGVQDIDTRRPVTPDTVFRIASMTKAFTALSILKLRDEGKLALDTCPSCAGGNIRPTTLRKFACASC
jgi:CubicO group peptidase (beta-lactamase class C family)